jgi:hypothetical protein
MGFYVEWEVTICKMAIVISSLQKQCPIPPLQSKVSATKNAIIIFITEEIPHRQPASGLKKRSQFHGYFDSLWALAWAKPDNFWREGKTGERHCWCGHGRICSGAAEDKAPPHGSSWRFGSMFSVLSSVWVSLCVWRVCVVTSRVSPCRLMASLIQSQAYFEPYVWHCCCNSRTLGGLEPGWCQKPSSLLREPSETNWLNFM